MPPILSAARAAVTRELERFRNRHFLEASMAASALLALADEEIALSERLALDFVLENLKELKIFDAHKAVNLFRDHAERIQRDVGSGKEKVVKAVAKFAGDEHAGQLIIRACVCIAKADGNFSEEEKAVIAELCQVLNLDPSKLGI
jgi:tellurite resistance protein